MNNPTELSNKELYEIYLAVKEYLKYLEECLEKLKQNQ